MENIILKGDCLVELKKLADCSIDSIVTDPPYELGFMGKKWDGSGIAYNVELWQEALRVLKPGGHLLAFGGTRTYHRMAVAIEDAGFEIRDSIHWTYGSGFPKSLDVSKAIDKIGGQHPNWNPQAYEKAVRASGKTHADVDDHLGIKASSCYWARTDHRSCVPLYSHWVRVRDFLGLDDAFATVTQEAERKDRVVEAGVSSTSLSSETVTVVNAGSPQTGAAATWQGWGTALKPSHEPIVVARKPLTGTVASNVLEHGTGALNIDGSRIGTEERHNPSASNSDRESWRMNTFESVGRSTQGRFPANTILTHSTDCQPPDCVPGCPAGELGEPARFFHQTEGWDHDWDTLVYIAKPSKRERNAGLDGLPKKDNKFGNQKNGEDIGNGSVNDKFTTTPNNNFHPTVKPVALMRYLVKLVTPPNGVVLDPFLGSGTTAVAATLEGFKWIGCEMTEEYYSIIEARVSYAQQEYKKQTQQLELDNE